MRIFYENTRIKKICENRKDALKALPQKAADSLDGKLVQLRAFDNLGQIQPGPPLKFEALGENYKYHFSIRIDEKQRVVFKPVGLFQRLEDQSADLNTVVDVEIVFIGDYHRGA